MKNIGEIIKYLRKSKKLSQEDLSELVGCSREFISQIERNKCNLPDYLILPLSKFLSHDISNLIKNIDKYENFNHYLISHKLIDLIEKKDNHSINLMLKNKTIVNEFDYGYPKVLKLYCSSLIETVINKDIEMAIEICMQQLSLNNIYEIPNFKPTLGAYDRYYSTIIILGVNLHLVGKNELHKTLLFNTILFFEENIFNEFLPISTVDYFFKKYYILLLNNYADTLFTLGEFENALITCEKATLFAIDNQILYMVDLLTKLKIEILYNLNEVDKSKETYLQFKYICQLINNNSYFEDTTETFKIQYSNIF